MHRIPMLLIKEFFGKMFCRYFFSNLKSHIFAFPKFTNLIYSITIIFFLEKMTKADIVNEIAKNTGIDRATVYKTLEAFMDSVVTSLAREENVYLRGFGSFIVKKRAQKIARNISKNTTIIIPEHNTPAFKPAKDFTDAVRKI